MATLLVDLGNLKANKFYLNLVASAFPKGGFFSESAIRFLHLQISKKKYSKKLSWAWNLNLLFTIIGRKFKFQAQDSFLE